MEGGGDFIFEYAAAKTDPAFTPQECECESEGCEV